MPDGIKRIFATPLDAMDDAAKEELGTIRREGNKTYKYVQFSGVPAGAVVAVAAGDIVYYDTHANNIVHGDVSSAEGVTFRIAAGQAQAAWDGVQAAASDKFGWIQIKGASQILPVDVVDVTEIGEAVTVVAATTTDLSLELAVSVTTTAVPPIFGIMTNITTATMTVLLDCPF